MATRKKRTVAVDTSEYNRLEMYCIWLNEFYTSLLRAGFKHDIALAIVVDKEAYPDWVEWKLPTNTDISRYMDEDED